MFRWKVRIYSEISLLNFWFFFSVNEEEILPDLSEDESAILRMEDCEAFKCEVVSVGRQAYDLVAKSLRENEQK